MLDFPWEISPLSSPCAPHAIWNCPCTKYLVLSVLLRACLVPGVALMAHLLGQRGARHLSVELLHALEGLLRAVRRPLKTL